MRTLSIEVEYIVKREEIEGLIEERDMLTIKNKYLARHLLQNGYKENEVNSIAKGFDDWREE